MWRFQGGYLLLQFLYGALGALQAGIKRRALFEEKFPLFFEGEHPGFLLESLQAVFRLLQFLVVCPTSCCLQE